MNLSLVKAYKVYKRDGISQFFELAYQRLRKPFMRILLRPFAIPVALGIIAISPFIRIRLIRLYSNRIGHYAFHTEYWLTVLDFVNTDKKIKTFYYALPDNPICNTQLHKMWKRVLTILPFPYLWSEVNRYLNQYGRKHLKKDLLKDYYETQDTDRWNIFRMTKQCHTYFTKKEIAKGYSILKEMGISPDDRFICILGRDQKYLNTIYPDTDHSYHGHRNVTISHYQKAAIMLAKKGYHVIRIGKYVQDHFYSSHPNIIDYANTSLRSDFMDIFLSAHCYFFMSVGTGIDGVATMFRRPILVTNFPLSDIGVQPDWNIFIPKKILNKNTNTILTFKEIFNNFSKMGQEKILKLAREYNFEYIENTEDEILEATNEMENNLTNNWCYDETDHILQKRFWENFPEFPNTKYIQIPQIKLERFKYTDGKNHLRIGSHYIKNNQDLLN